MGIDDEDAKVGQALVPRRRQSNAVNRAEGKRVRLGEEPEQMRQIRRTARHRADHGPVALMGQWRRRRRLMASARHQTKTRLMSVDAAEVRRNSQGAGDVGTIDTAPYPAASAAAEPPDEPPGVRPIFHGLRVVP